MSDSVEIDEMKKSFEPSKDLEKLAKNYHTYKIILLGFFSVVLTYYSGLYIYWYFEPDPLTVERAEGCSPTSICVDRKYSFMRKVHSSKDLLVHVQERYYEMDGTLDVGGLDSELVNGTAISYPITGGITKNYIFPKVLPHDLPVGHYEYRPIATYVVNPIKTITKPLPTQTLFVHCDPIKNY